MKDTAPPVNHNSSTATLLPALAATKAGLSKMPAPITIPTIKATASPNANEGFGAATSFVPVCFDKA